MSQLPAKCLDLNKIEGDLAKESAQALHWRFDDFIHKKYFVWYIDKVCYISFAFKDFEY